MSQTLSAVAVTFFDSQVKQAYQHVRMLRDTVYYKTNLGADTFKFPKLGKGVAKQAIPQAEINLMGVTWTQVSATPSDWVAAELTSIFSQAKTNVKEQAELAETIANAIGRREDQLIINALNAASMASGHTVDVNVGGSNTGLNMAKLRRAARILDDKGVPGEKGDRTLVQSVQGKENLLGETAPTSSDYNSVLALVNGQLDYYVGFMFKWIGTRDEGGLTLSTNTRDGFAYHKRAVGLGVTVEKTTEVNYIPLRLSWLAAQPYSAGATMIEDLGVVKVQGYEA